MVRLPNYVAGQLNRPAASKINELAPKDQDITVVGYNELAPIVYGEQLVSGPVIAGPVQHANSLVYAIAVSYVGEIPIEGYTGILINGKREADPPVITTNPAAFSRAGISIRLYDGTQTTPDATLRAAFGSEYEDVFPNISYAVISIPASQSATLDFANAVKFIVRGKKCWDPRIEQFAWTENPSLHFADYVTEGFHGFRKDIKGAAECANWNDSLYNGLPRVRSGVVINEVLKEHEVLDLFSTYAECLWSYDGEQIRIIPDAPVTGPIDTIEARSIREKTLTFSTTNLEQMPTAVSVFFSDRESEEWGSLPGYAQSTEHEIYGAAASKSDVQLLGIYRRVEGDRRAWERLLRLQTPGRISWQMYSEGIQYQAGDVVRLPNVRGLHNLDVRLMSQPEMLAPGVYQMHSEIYRSDHYPAGKDGASIPPGGVLFADSMATPENYEDISPVENIPIYGVGATDATGVLAHSGQVPEGNMPYTLSSAGGHDGPIDTLGAVARVSTTPNPPIFITGRQWEPPHDHSGALNAAIAANSDAVRKKSLRLLINRSTSFSETPNGLVFLSAGALSQEGVSELAIGNTVEVLSAFNALVETAPTLTIHSTSTEAVGHNHYKSYPNSYENAVPGPTLNHFYSQDLKYHGKHAHTVSGTRSQKLRSKGVGVHRLSKGALIPKGGIIGFLAGTAIPSGWKLCDGTNDTPDLRQFFIKPVRASDAGSIESEINEVDIVFPTTTAVSASHSHEPKPQSGYFEVALRIAHATNVTHTHSVSGVGQRRTFNYIPRRYGMRFIQYKGD